MCIRMRRSNSLIECLQPGSSVWRVDSHTFGIHSKQRNTNNNSNETAIFQFIGRWMRVDRDCSRILLMITKRRIVCVFVCQYLPVWVHVIKSQFVPHCTRPEAKIRKHRWDSSEWLVTNSMGKSSSLRLDTNSVHRLIVLIAHFLRPDRPRV